MSVSQRRTVASNDAEANLKGAYDDKTLVKSLGIFQVIHWAYS